MMMFLQRNSRTDVGCFRPNRKCFAFNGCLIFLLVLLAATLPPQATARPNYDDENLPPSPPSPPPPQPFSDSAGGLRDDDNFQIHGVKMVDDIKQEEHPIIVYKEDFVTADYVPPSKGTKAEKQHKRRSKDAHHRKRHNNQNFSDVVIKEKPEKILFDVIPETPIIVPEDMDKSKVSDLQLEPLIKDTEAIEMSEATETAPLKKQQLQKRPKKYHQRVRRSASGEHLVHKRNPYFRQVPKIVDHEAPTQHVQYIYIKHAVAGKKHNGLDIPVAGNRPTSGPNVNMPMSFDNRIAADENDRVIFSSGRRTTTRPTEAPESIFRDPRPENFDFSFMNQRRPAATTARTPIFTRQPQATRQQPAESIFRDPRPQNFDFSFMNPRGQSTSVAPARIPVLTTTRPQAVTSAAISQCVWAIVNCCSVRSTDIRYNCFEQNGCYGAFWGLNPCADNIRDNVVNVVADYYN